ncbi:MAG: MFS transporter, partial [Candidatus Eisenbacteria bacterium]|nr:MFS transporter [Candidatus Eisenbacteria bacterium]
MHLSAAVPAPWRGFWDRFAFPPSESAEESRAFREHLLSSFWAGTSGGVFLLTDVILAKTLNATGWQMTLMASLGPIASLMSFAWVGLVTGKRRGSSFFLAALLGKIPIVLVLVFKTATYMVFMTFLSSLIGALMMTGTNSIYQACYSEKTRAHRYALATSVGTVFSILSAQVSGAILERNERVWPYLFVISALMSLLAVYHTYRMDVASGDRRDARAWLRMGAESLRSSVRTRPHFEPAGVGRSFGDAVRISRENPEFFRFEMNFMVYGIAFLAILPIFP